VLIADAEVAMAAIVVLVVLLVGDGGWAVAAPSVGSIAGAARLDGTVVARRDCCCAQLLAELCVVVVQLLHRLCGVVWSAQCHGVCCSARLLVVVFGNVSVQLAAEVLLLAAEGGGVLVVDVLAVVLVTGVS